MTVSTPDSAAARIAVPAPPWIAAAAFAASCLVPAWRRQPVTAVPALLSVVPWLPLPLPAIALVWTGPLAWAPIGAAVVAAILASPARVGWRMTVAGQASAAGALAMAVSVAVVVALAPRLPGSDTPGDEPHYLIITQSLLYDGDLDIRNNHDARQYAAYASVELQPDFLRPGKGGETYSIHAPGVPAIVLPGFAAFGYRGAQATIVLLAALTAVLIWWIGWRATGSAAAAWFAWSAVLVTPTFLLQSVTIYPDGPGALATAAAVWLLMRLREGDRLPGPVAVAGVSGLLAALPWMHTRFVVLAAGFGAAIVVQLAMTDAAGRARRLTAFLAVPALSAAAWFASFHVMYGTPDPTAPYGPPSGDRSIAFAPGGVAGLFFDQQFGLIAFAPVLLTAVAGAVAALGGRWRFAAAASALSALAYLTATGTYWMWWAGVPAPPARFLMAVLPVLALPLACGWQRMGAPARMLALSALVWSAVVSIAVITVGRGDLAWSVRDGQAPWLEWLGPVVDLPRGWPSFFWRLTPADVRTEWPFAVHTAVWLGAIAATAAVALAVARRARTGAGQAAAAATGVLVALMTSVQAGWWLNGTNGLDPARSQLAALAASSRGERPALIRFASVEGRTAAIAALAVRPEEPPRFRPEWPWALFRDVPAGEYGIVVTLDRPRSGELVVRDGARQIAAYSLAPRSRQTLPLPLPEGARALSVELNAELLEVGAAVELVITGQER